MVVEPATLAFAVGEPKTYRIVRRPVLTPWSSANATGRQYLAERLVGDRDAYAFGEGDELAEAASAVIEDYASGAPQAVRNEAMIRFLGYLVDVPARSGALKSETAGPIRQEYVTNHSDAFTRSGAQALLGRWRVRSAGVCGGDE